MAPKLFPGFSSIYELTERGNSTHFRADVMLPDGFSAVRGEAVPVEPVSARWMMGRFTPTDVIWTSLVAPIIVSDRLVAILRHEGFVGWDTFNVSLKGKSGEPIDGYSGLVVRGRCGKIEDTLSVQFDKTMPAGVFPWWRGLYFDPATWDGSDFFMPAGNVGWVFVTEAVKRALEKAKVRNVEFIALSEVERLLL